jgi:hypothetical protein
LDDGVVTGTLASKLTGTLKSTYDDLIKAGLNAEEKANSILLRNIKGETVAIIENGKLTPSKWKDTHLFKGTIAETNEGYKLLKDGDDFYFNLGFKDGRVLSSEEVNAYFKAIGKHEPYKQGAPVIERQLQVGDKVYVIEYKTVNDIIMPNPGGWGSKNQVSLLKEVRENMSILYDWKNVDAGELVVREYTVIKPLPVRDGVTGPLKEISKGAPNPGEIYFGGEQQYEFIENLRGTEWEKYYDKNNIKYYDLR